MTRPIISVRSLSKTYRSKAWLLGSSHDVAAVKNISFDVFEGQTLGVVGESGSGKSTLGKMLTGIEKADQGEVLLAGLPIAELKSGKPVPLGKIMQYVFQDPVSSLNPRCSISAILDVPLRNLLRLKPAEREERKRQLLAAVKLPQIAMAKFPHEFSGGQAQRIAIARALAAEPRIMVLDEAVSALDVSVQAEILLLLQDLREKHQLTYVFISHNLPVVQAMAENVIVMKEGEIVDSGPTNTLFSGGRHAYTDELIASNFGTETLGA